jgi:hypothetical protein
MRAAAFSLGPQSRAALIQANNELNVSDDSGFALVPTTARFRPDANAQGVGSRADSSLATMGLTWSTDSWEPKRSSSRSRPLDSDGPSAMLASSGSGVDFSSEANRSRDDSLTP